MTALLRRPLVQVLRNVTGPPRRTWSAPQSVHGPVPGGDGGACGLSSLTAMWEHTTDLTVADLEALGVEAGWALSSESTIRRVLQDLDPADVEAHLRPWLCTRTGTIEGRTVAGVVTTFSPSKATRRLCVGCSRGFPKRASRPSQVSTPLMGGGCDAPSKPSSPPPGRASPQPSRWSGSDAPGPPGTARKAGKDSCAKTTAKKTGVEVVYPGLLPTH